VAGAHSRNTVFSGLTYTTSFNALSDPVHFTLDTATGAGLSINSIKGNFGFHDGTVAVAFDSHGNMVLGGFMRESLFLNHPSVPIISRTGGYTDLWIAKLAKTDCNGVPLSLDQQESQTSLQLVQNPVKDLLSFKELPHQNNLSFKIYSLAGRVVLENTLNTNHPKIDVSQLNAGSYFIQVYMDNNHQTLKFVKE
ncbi:MAG: T9SS type A sorting domain-containing protein, partial [Bacteroidota bacterium]|nr:T9SS type A sorting domain-containing protein [Bacteroidota bacterium]